MTPEQSRRTTLLASLALVALAACWGSTFFLIKDLLDRVPTLDFLAVRFSVAALALLVVAPRAIGRISPVVRRHALVLGLLYGLAQILQTTGLAHTPASVSGFVVIEGAAAAAGNQFQSIMVYPVVTSLSDATGDASERSSPPRFSIPGTVNADGSFILNGLQAGGVSFRLSSFSGGLRIKRIERDGVEVKDAIEVRPGEKITGVRIVAHRAQGRIRGQVQIAGGALLGEVGVAAHAEEFLSA